MYSSDAVLDLCTAMQWLTVLLCHQAWLHSCCTMIGLWAWRVTGRECPRGRAHTQLLHPKTHSMSRAAQSATPHLPHTTVRQGLLPRPAWRPNAAPHARTPSCMHLSLTTHAASAVPASTPQYGMDFYYRAHLNAQVQPHAPTPSVPHHTRCLCRALPHSMARTSTTAPTPTT